MVDEYSTDEISEALIATIKESLNGKQYGSVEIYIEGGRVAQITERVIKKTAKLNETQDKKSEVVYWRPIKNRK
ncbi:MAG: DUF2292 domain-containing protein [Candidatus Woykebacteria bacterium]